MDKKKVYVLSGIFLVLVIVALIFITQKFGDQDLEYEEIDAEAIVGQAGLINLIASCEDSDNGLIWEEFGTVTLTFNDGNTKEVNDNCVDDTTLIEVRCNGDRLNGAKYNCSLDGHICDNGVCVEEEPLCIDSDGGSDYYVKGETIGMIGGEILTYEDLCYNYGDLTEYSCDGFDIISEVIELPDEHTCEDGAFVEVEQECVDTDGGSDYYVKGETTGIIGGEILTYEDLCYNYGDLVEYSCDGLNINSEVVIKPEGYTCEDGVFVLQ
jgi:hypothetical protein